ncbi:hypothetical protein C0989_012512 [Termitomyces sp. Mn162]|nr:hypothetical protein C0989_012512 [Termitomyces sp. Mn162]
MSSEAETLAILLPSSPSSSSESSHPSESLSSEDGFPFSHHNNPVIKPCDSYPPSGIAPANQKNMSATLAFNPEGDDQCPLAEVKIMKLMECPMLTEGRMDNHVFQQWTIACHCYQKHSGKKDSEIVSFIADRMLKPRFVTWYHANQSKIDAMSLNQYLSELQKFALPRRWQTKVDHAKIPESGLADWVMEVIELDEELAEEQVRTQVMIDANNAEWAGKRKPLAERISEPPSCTISTSSTISGTSTLRLKLAKLTDKEKRLLTKHQGCTHCRIFYCGHSGNPEACPMKVSNSQPDPRMTKTLMLAMALAAKPKNVTGLAYVEPMDEGEIRDKDTDDLYIEELIKKLGLKRFPLTQNEDNLTSLTQSPLSSHEYICLEATVSNGAWKSKVHKAKVNVGLPVPLLLGIPFMSAENLVLDIKAHTAIDKCTGFNIANPLPSSSTLQAPGRMSHRAKRMYGAKQYGHTEGIHHEDYAPPGQIMALIRERIETLSLEEELEKRHAEAKHVYADHFPSELPKTTDEVVKSQGYSAPKKFHKSWKKLLEEHLTAGHLCLSLSEFASPAFCIPKHQNGVPDFTVPP